MERAAHDVKDGLRIGQAVRLEVVVQPDAWRAEVGDARRDRYAGSCKDHDASVWRLDEPGNEGEVKGGGRRGTRRGSAQHPPAYAVAKCQHSADECCIHNSHQNTGLLTPKHIKANPQPQSPAPGSLVRRGHFYWKMPAKRWRRSFLVDSVTNRDKA